MDETFTCDRCGRETAQRELKEVYERSGDGRKRLEVCPECLDELLEAADHVEGMPGEKKRAAARVESGAETVAPTGARPATTTSSAAEQRPEQAADAPKEGTFLTTAARDVDSLPDEEQDDETSPRRAEASRAPGLEHDVQKEEQERPDAGVEGVNRRDVGPRAED